MDEQINDSMHDWMSECVYCCAKMTEGYLSMQSGQICLQSPFLAVHALLRGMPVGQGCLGMRQLSLQPGHRGCHCCCITEGAAAVQGSSRYSSRQHTTTPGPASACNC